MAENLSTWDFYRKALFKFENLPLEKQPQRMGNSGRECMKKCFTIFTGIKTKCIKFLQFSKGTLYSGLPEYIV